MYRFLVLSAAFLSGAAALAQQPAPVVEGPLTLSECLELALQLNPSLTGARENARASRAAFVQTRSQLFPGALLTGSYDAQRSRSRTSTVGGLVKTSGGTSYIYQYRAAINQMIYRTGLWDEVKRARANSRASAHDAEDTRRQLILSVTESYYTLLASQRLREVADESVQVATENLALVEAQVQAGAAAPVDALPMRTALAQARADLIAAQTTEDLAAVSLRAMLGLPAGQSVEIVDLLAEKPLEIDPRQALADALRQRPDHQAAEQRANAARAALRIARAERWPTLNVQGSVAHDVFEDAGASIWSFLAEVSYPIFDAGSTKAAQTQADANYRAALAGLAGTELQIGLEVEQAYVAIEQGLERIQATDAAVREATANLEAARARLAEDAAIPLEVTTAQEDMTRARAEQVQALYDYNLAIAQLQAAVGG